MKYKILIEQNRSIIEAHTTKEYEFVVDNVSKETIEDCIRKTGVEMSGMIGVSIVSKKKSDDFFVTVENGKLQSWR